MRKKGKKILSIIVLIVLGVFMLNKLIQQYFYWKICEKVVEARYTNTWYEIWDTDNTFFELGYDELSKKHPYLQDISSLELGHATGVNLKLLDDENIVVCGRGIFYINFKNKNILRHIQFSHKGSICLDVLDDKNLIYIVDGEIYTYDYESDTIKKNEHINIMDLYCGIGQPRRIPSLYTPKISYSKKYNTILYSALCVHEDGIDTPEIFAINLNKNEVKFVGEGACPQCDEGQLYYSNDDIIYEYLPKEELSVKVCRHRRVFFDYSTEIRWFKKLGDYFFIVTDGRSIPVLGYYPTYLFIYYKNYRLKVNRWFHNSHYNGRNIYFTEDMDVIYSKKVE